MKKIFTLFAALAMVMSMFAANIPAGTKLYLTPNSNWKQANARFAAYFFGNGDAWVSMTKVEGETDLYEVISPNKSYTNVIFCRMNPSAAANNWNNKWNQTGDLTYDGTKNHYTMNSGSWDAGTWSRYVATYVVTIEAENGTVTGLAAGGTYEGGTTATLTAAPNDGYEFVNWTVGGKEVSTANPYTFTVNDNITLVANFKEAAAKSYTITTSATNGTVEGAATVVEGESVTLTATANPGYKFVNWTVGGVEVSTDNPYTFVPTEDATVVANFEQLPPETVYFVNAADWTGTINIHAWGGTASGTAWPGNPAHKEDYQIGGHDVYSLTAAAGAYANVIFNNKVGDAGNQTADLEWTAGKYYVVDEWLTKEEAEEKLASGEPLGLTYNVTVPAGTNACYIAGEMNGWSQQEMTKVDDTHYTITIVGATTAMKYKYCSGPAWDYEELNADGSPVADRTHSENDVVAKWKKVYNPNPTVDPEPDPTYDYYVVGTFNSWANPDPDHGMTLVGDVYKATVTLNVGANMLKVTNGTWDNAKGFDAIGAEYEEVSNDTKDGNILITLSEGKDVVVVYNATTGKVTFEGLTEKVVVTPDVITYVLMGVGGDWTTGIALTKNETAEYGEEYVLLGQEIAEGDAVKVVTLVNGVAKSYCGAVEKATPVKFEFDNDGNIVLLPGKYDFYFKVNDPTTYEDDAMYIAGEAYPVEPEVIEYELNGGEFPAVVVPTNAELWEAFKPYYNTYYGLTRADQPIDKVSTFASAYMQKIMTDEASEYKWLGDYVLSVATAAGVTLSTDMAAANESGWRWAVHAFFNAAAGQYGAAGIDFTEAGKQEVWGAAYEAEYGVVLPTEPVDAPYTLPTPVKEGYKFVGWYDNAEGTGEAYTVIPAGWAGTLYAIWEVEGPATALENIAVEGKAVKAIINGQLIIIKNGVQYNAQGAILK